VDNRHLPAVALELRGLCQSISLLTARLRQAHLLSQEALVLLQDLQRLTQTISRLSSAIAAHDLAQMSAGLEACLQGVAEVEDQAQIPRFVGPLADVLEDATRYFNRRVSQLEEAGHTPLPPTTEEQAALATIEARLLQIGSQLTPAAGPETPPDEALSAEDLEVLRRFQESTPDEREEPSLIEPSLIEPSPIESPAFEAAPIGPAPLPLPPITPQTEAPQEEDIPPEMLELFWVETREDLSMFQAALAQIETAEERSATVQEMRRIAHKIKGAASTLNLQVTSGLAHCLEDVLDLLRNRKLHYAPSVLDLLVFGLAELENILQLPPGTEPAESEGLAALQMKYQELLEAAQPSAGIDPAATQPDSQRLAEAARQRETPDGSDHSGSSLDQPHKQEGWVMEREHFLRVDARRLDQVMNLLAELATSRAATEQERQEINTSVAELRPALQRVTQVIGQLSDYEVALQERRGQHPPAPPDTDQALSAAQRPPKESATTAVKQVLSAPLQFNRARALTTPAAPKPASKGAPPEIEHFSEHDDLLRALRESINDITTIGNTLQEHLTRMDKLSQEQDSLTTTLQRNLTHVRLVPIEQLLPRLRLTARMVAQEQNKLINFQATGESTEIDRDIIEAITGPLVQLVRNCAAHGIESSQERREQGKPETGTIWLHAYYSGNEISIEVGDDGRGINAQRLIAAALASSKLTSEQAVMLTHEEALNLILLPDLSTSPEVTTISGRGVGMDLVQATVDRLKGSLHIHSAPGHGTTFHIRLPISQGILRALFVRAQQQTYAVPFSAVERIALQASDHADGQTVLFTLGQLLGMAPLHASITSTQTALPLHQPALLIPLGQRHAGVLVEEVLGEREIVIKPLPAHLRRPGIRGATITPTGELLLLLDVPELAHRALGNATSQPLSQGGAQKEGHMNDNASSSPVILVVDDSLSMRRTLEFQLTRAGYRVITARDGLEALEVLAKSRPNAVLLDIEMPHMDGYELLARLRSQAEFKHLPVAMLTSRAADIHREHALNLGANAYLVKPYPHDQLLSTVAGLVQQSQ
jgi:chemosensory pili system protein ChpA (sensor histidine kinase/response regulator)